MFAAFPIALVMRILFSPSTNIVRICNEWNTVQWLVINAANRTNQKISSYIILRFLDSQQPSATLLQRYVQLNIRQLNEMHVAWDPVVSTFPRPHTGAVTQ